MAKQFRNSVSRSFEDPETGKVVTRFVTGAYHGNCTTPVFVGLTGGHDNAERSVRCRRCPGCVRARRHLWRLRAEAETLAHTRTWFFTGTFKQQNSAYDCGLEPKDCVDRGCVAHECTRFLKRLRRRFDRINVDNIGADGVRIRYLLVYERHKSGALHTHALLHTNGTLRYRDIKDSWRSGFMDVKLCDFRTAGYVTKYVTKGVFDARTQRLPRIRASRNPPYGGWIMEQDEEVLKELLSNRPKEELEDIWKKNLDQAIREIRSQRTRPADLMHQLRNLKS